MKMKILLVEDDANLVELLRYNLESAGFDVVQTGDGEEALLMARERTPDIVLLDWMMPELSGLETLREIRAVHPKTRLPVIMCTAVDEETSVVAALAEGANDYMIKPISLPILRARMKSHLEQQQAIETLGNEKAQAERKLDEQTRTMFSMLQPRNDEAGR